ncbi:branched-chain amino acid ABC transporter permease [Roseovarius indicus]|uniref:LIV-I protein H n=1 Tax=Roseovarius indicus TaxID=540747 RepID=A0A0T5P2C8_9RHOB|nr:branched-chain amino acid ABC transporter permease [Roseovarius indicus]KRS15260.1 urea ABC transporter [Roseovarius indicus]QEW25090.1 LIV-I protein H [Roseovarius indicus]SFE38447.1 branched-chain amino acid transport system permease protein [Roseovarius indicus]
MAIATIQILNTIASLALISVGLAIIFGMMKVMNFAHGELLMLGAYSVQTAYSNGVNIWIAMFVIAPLFVGLVGILIELLVIRHLYGRMMDTLLATWGISLFITGLITMIFGNVTQGISTPLGFYEIGGIRDSAYKFLIIGVTIVVFGGIYLVLKKTRLGLIARATMNNPGQVAVLGVNPRIVYTVTFAAGAAISGLAGAVLAPVTGVVPTMGAAYIGKAFITVICGGDAIFAGTAIASILFGSINQVTTIVSTAEFGEVALLIGALLMLRLLPKGISSLVSNRAV